MFGQRFIVKIIDYNGKGERENVGIILTTKLADSKLKNPKEPPKKSETNTEKKTQDLIANASDF